MTNESFKELRTRHNLTIENAAAVLGVTVSAVRQIERRERDRVFSKGNRRSYNLLAERLGPKIP